MCHSHVGHCIEIKLSPAKIVQPFLLCYDLLIYKQYCIPILKTMAFSFNDLKLSLISYGILQQVAAQAETLI